MKVCRLRGNVFTGWRGGEQTDRHIVEKTNTADKRPEEQSERTESCRENFWNEIQLKGA